jgi:tetratricopeptide (TPR) repeat protein
LDDFVKAHEDAENAINLKPNYVKAYYQHGLARLGMCRYEDALSDFRLDLIHLFLF